MRQRGTSVDHTRHLGINFIVSQGLANDLLGNKKAKSLETPFFNARVDVMLSDVYLHSRVNHRVLDWYRPCPTLPLLEIAISGLEGDSRFILDCLDTFEIIWINMGAKFMFDINPELLHSL